VIREAGLRDAASAALANIAAAAQVAQRQPGAKQRDSYERSQTFEPFWIQLIFGHQSHSEKKQRI
jgi:hypothetical protein